MREFEYVDILTYTKKLGKINYTISFLSAINYAELGIFFLAHP